MVLPLWRLLIQRDVSVDCAGTGHLLQSSKHVPRRQHTPAPPRTAGALLQRLQCDTASSCKRTTLNILHATTQAIHNLSTCPVHATLQQVPTVHITNEICLNQQLLFPFSTQPRCRCGSSGRCRCSALRAVRHDSATWCRPSRTFLPLLFQLLQPSGTAGQLAGLSTVAAAAGGGCACEALSSNTS